MRFLILIFICLSCVRRQSSQPELIWFEQKKPKYLYAEIVNWKDFKSLSLEICNKDNSDDCILKEITDGKIDILALPYACSKLTLLYDKIRNTNAYPFCVEDQNKNKMLLSLSENYQRDSRNIQRFFSEVERNLKECRFHDEKTRETTLSALSFRKNNALSYPPTINLWRKQNLARRHQKKDKKKSK